MGIPGRARPRSYLAQPERNRYRSDCHRPPPPPFIAAARNRLLGAAPAPAPPGTAPRGGSGAPRHPGREKGLVARCGALVTAGGAGCGVQGIRHPRAGEREWEQDRGGKGRKKWVEERVGKGGGNVKQVSSCFRDCFVSPYRKQGNRILRRLNIL